MLTCEASRPLCESILMRAGPGWPLISDLPEENTDALPSASAHLNFLLGSDEPERERERDIKIDIKIYEIPKHSFSPLFTDCLLHIDYIKLQYNWLTAPI